MKHRSTRASVALATVAGVTLAVLASPASAAPQAAPQAAAQAGDKTPLGLAVAAADRAVASGVDSLVNGTQDSYDRQMVTPWVNNLYSVAYERTYRGLDVVGGDAVVLADGTGAVRATQTASQAKINVPVTAKVSAAAAQKTSRAKLAKVDKVAAPRLVVRVLNEKAHLAWETVVSGSTKTAPSNLHVFVDAITGKVIDTRDDVVAGTGNSKWNGPTPLKLDTSGSGSSFSLKDPTRSGVSCGDESTKSTMTGSDDSWGNGNPTSRETGCVDALFASQTQWEMLKDWLGRNGLNGKGGGWPVYVGLNQVNAYWNGSSVSIGHNNANEWIAALDVVGHENGHGIDTNTPGGAGQEAGLGEGTGDIFGALVEAYANEPSPYDTPGDYMVGEMINLVGKGPIRNMSNPSTVGDPSCYSSSIPGTEVHAAAGPLNHWFYMLAEGTAPTTKVPNGSKACNSATLEGVGIQDAGKVFYGAMLLKTSGMTYKKYRVATLASAKNLDPTCTLFNKTKAAWDAITLPAQSGETTCTPSGNADFSLSLNPASGSIKPGTSTTSTVGTSAIGTAQSVNLTASGAPSGVSVTFDPATVTAGQSSKMTVTASSSAAAGSSTIKVTGKGTTLSHTADYNLTVSSTGPDPDPTPTDIPDIDVDAVQGHLAQLQTIATNNGGNRRAGSAGYTASVAYVKSKLEAAGYTVSEQVCTSCTYRSNNLIADWPGGPADQVTMFGAHLDSVQAGPGMNDNGSGSATLLENALAVAKAKPTMTKHLRFAWWTDEESGLNGSKYYVSQLSSTQKSAIKAYYNFDMVASTNGGYFINNLNSAASAPMKAYWDSLNLAPEENVEGQGRSDDYSFKNAGIATSGYAMGASARKNTAQANKWGGKANAAYDPCYHSACDTKANINAEGLNRAADGVAYTIWKTSVKDVPPTTDDFAVKVSPASGSVDPGASTAAKISTSVVSGKASTIKLTASGAPSGVSVSFNPDSVTAGSSSTMNVSASSTAVAGNYTITVTGTSGTIVHTTTFSLTVGGETPPGDCVDAIKNGGFESGTAPWTTTRDVVNNSAAQPAKSGSYKAWFNGYGSTRTDNASQSVAIPAGCTKLSFYLHIDTDEGTSSYAYDKFTVSVDGKTLATYSNVDRSTGYTLKTLDVSSVAGKTVTLKFEGIEDAYQQTSFVVDDVKLGN